MGELRALIAGLADDEPLVVAATPDANGWTQRILYMLGTCVNGGTKTVVLGLSEEAASEEEFSTFSFPARPI